MRRYHRITLATVFALSFLIPATSVFAAARPFDRSTTALDLASVFAAAVGPAGPLLRALDGSQAIDNGTDGRLTFLLVGSDASANAVARTDTIMVMSIKGNTISAASIPRDTKLLPNPFTGGVTGKVNSVVRQIFKSNGSLDVALDKFEVIVENALGIEIDYHALIWFAGFTTLVDLIDGGTNVLKVNIGRRIYDSRHFDKPGAHSFGVYFPQATDYQLFAWNPPSQTGSPYCDGTFKLYSDPANHPETWCRRALPYVRSRHGSSDWARSQRQQKFIVSAINAVDTNEISSLVSTGIGQGMGKWWTNFPMTLENSTDLYNLLQGASLVNKIVFKPRVYATHIPGQNGYQLNLPAVRAWCDKYMS